MLPVVKVFANILKGGIEVCVNFIHLRGKEIGKEEFICRYSTIYYLDYNLQNDFPIGALKSKASKTSRFY